MLTSITVLQWTLGVSGGFGAHTRTIQARHVVRGLKSETTLAGSMSLLRSNKKSIKQIK